jgi:hypothetical protein
MLHLDLQRIIFEAEAFRATLRNHLGMRAAHDYDAAIGVSNLIAAEVKLMQAIEGSTDDLEAKVCCDVLRRNAGWFVGAPDDTERLAAIENALQALKDIDDRRQSPAPPTLVSETPQPSLDDLTPTAWELLKAIYRLKALNAQTRKTREAVAAEAHTGNHNSSHTRKAFAQLAESGLIISRRGVGTCITTAGRKALKSGKKVAT